MFNLKKFIKENYEITGQSSGNLIIECMFCGDEKHMWVHPEKGFYHCFKCEAGGNTVGFLMKFYKISYEEAVEIIQEGEAVDVEDLVRELKDLYDGPKKRKKESVPFYKAEFPKSCVELNKRARSKIWAIETRSYPISFLKKFGLKFCVRGRYRQRVIIPIKTLEHFTFQAYSTKRDSAKKVLNPSGGVKSIFVYMYNDFRKAKEIIVVEGIFDALRLIQFGYNAMAILGKKMSKVQKQLLLETNAREVIFCLDEDAYELMIKQARKFSGLFSEKVSFIPLIGHKDPDEIMHKEIFDAFYRNRVGLEDLDLLTREIEKLTEE